MVDLKGKHPDIFKPTSDEKISEFFYGHGPVKPFIKGTKK